MSFHSIDGFRAMLEAEPDTVSLISAQIGLTPEDVAFEIAADMSPEDRRALFVRRTQEILGTDDICLGAGLIASLFCPMLKKADRVDQIILSCHDWLHRIHTTGMFERIVDVQVLTDGMQDGRIDHEILPPEDRESLSAALAVRDAMIELGTLTLDIDGRQARVSITGSSTNALVQDDEGMWTLLDAYPHSYDDGDWGGPGDDPEDGPGPDLAPDAPVMEMESA